MRATGEETTETAEKKQKMAIEASPPREPNWKLPRKRRQPRL